MIELKNKKGVSPVIGVILMVAITVILAAVIASFIFGMGTKVKKVPQVQLYLDDDPDEVDGDHNYLFKVTHYGGDDLDLKDIKLQVLGADGKIIDELIWRANTLSGVRLEVEYNNDEIISAGESFIVKERGNWIDKPVILILRVIHLPTGTIIFEGSVRVQ